MSRRFVGTNTLPVLNQLSVTSAAAKVWSTIGVELPPVRTSTARSGTQLAGQGLPAPLAIRTKADRTTVRARGGMLIGWEIISVPLTRSRPSQTMWSPDMGGNPTSFSWKIIGEPVGEVSVQPVLPSSKSLLIRSGPTQSVPPLPVAPPVPR